MLQLFYNATVVEMTPVSQTLVEFYEIAHVLSKTTSFYKKLKPLKSPFIKNSIFGYNRDPCASQDCLPTEHMSSYWFWNDLKCVDSYVVQCMGDHDQPPSPPVIAETGPS